MMKRLLWLCALAAPASLPAMARAADGYVTADVNLRAGPDVAYPRIDILPAGDTVDVFGCTEGWAWCDVGYRGDRGWVAGNYIEFFDNGPVALPSYGPRVGVPIVTFVIGNYWGRYYADRAFYRERDYWYRRPPPHRPPPPPPHNPWHRPGPPHGPPGHHHPSGPGPRPHPAPGGPGHGRPPGGHHPTPPSPGYRPPSPGYHPPPGYQPPSGRPPGNHPAPRPLPTNHAQHGGHPSQGHGQPAAKGPPKDGHHHH